MTKKKYVMTNETMVFHHGFPEEKTAILHRIQAVVDIPMHGVKAGDFGGFIENEASLSHKGNAWVGHCALVFDEAVVTGHAFVGGTSMVKQSRIAGRVIVNDAVLIERSVLDGKFRVDGNVELINVDWKIKRGEVQGTDYTNILNDSKIKERNIFIDDYGICALPPRSRYEGWFPFFRSTQLQG